MKRMCTTEHHEHYKRTVLFRSVYFGTFGDFQYFLRFALLPKKVLTSHGYRWVYISDYVVCKKPDWLKMTFTKAEYWSLEYLAKRYKEKTLDQATEQ